MSAAKPLPAPAATNPSPRRDNRCATSIKVQTTDASVLTIALVSVLVLNLQLVKSVEFKKLFADHKTDHDNPLS